MIRVNQQAATVSRVWWVDPANLVLFLTLPVFLGSTLVAGPIMTEQFDSFDFLSNGMIILGASCIFALAIGAKFGAFVASKPRPGKACFHPQRFDQFLVLLLVISLIANLLLLGSLILQPSLILRVLQGEKGGVFDAKDAMGQVVGITSLTNVSPLFCAMASIRYVTRGEFLPSRRVAVLAFLLPPLLLVHAFIGSERLVLIENGGAFLLPLFSFVPRLRRIATYAPLGGIVGMLSIFAAGEYMRSWAFYKYYYDSFVQFASFRLLGYLAVASNTGAGMISTMPPVGYPLITARWLTRLPFLRLETDYSRQYLVDYGNREFNNPGGIFAPIVDFGTTFGLLYLFASGAILGLAYGSYRRRNPIGLLIYPLLFIGLADLTQIWYWGEPRFIPELIFLAVAISATVRRPAFTVTRLAS
jgi:hypothetical protein